MRHVCWLVPTLILAAGCRDHAAETSASSSSAVVAPDHYGIGAPASDARLAALDIDVTPRGQGLPAGHGTAAQGAAIFAQKCALCHGPNGEGQGPYPRLIGAEPRDSFPFGRDPKLVKTIGNYWPYATTVYDYVHRAMPFNAPGSLSPDEVYGLAAFLLARNGIIGANDTLDARTLARVRMPARDRFVRDDRTGGTTFR